MDFSFSDEQLEFRDTIRSFAADTLNHGLGERDRAHDFSADSWARCADVGLLGLTLAPEWGGQGADALTAVLALEALGEGCRDNGLIFSLNAQLWSAATPIQRFGTAEQKQRWLPGMCDGSIIGVQSMSEPNAGSDAFSLTTRADTADGGWTLTGAKTWITNAPIADVFVVFATVDQTKGWAGLTAFLVERDRPGLTIGKPLEKMGLHTSPMAELHFDGCAVPAENLLGKVGMGMAIFNHSMSWERSMILASAVGTMQRQLDECVEFAKNRRQFDSPISKFQAVANTLVDMRLRIEAARMMLYRMAWLRAQGQRAEIEASLVKLYVSEVWVQSSLDQIQLHGALGYMSEAGVERDLRDAIASRIYSGTSQIQRNLIAKEMGL